MKSSAKHKQREKGKDAVGKKTAGGNLPISQLVPGEVWNDISPNFAIFFRTRQRRAVLSRSGIAAPRRRLAAAIPRPAPSAQSHSQHRLSGLILPHSAVGFSLQPRTPSCLLCWLLMARNIWVVAPIPVSTLYLPGSVPAPSSPQELQAPLAPCPSLWASEWSCWGSPLPSPSRQFAVPDAAPAPTGNGEKLGVEGKSSWP